jgi:hypothetical protein
MISNTMSTFQYHPNWHFAGSEEGLSFYTLTDSGFQKKPNVAFPQPSYQSKVCILHTKQRTWEQVGVREEFMNALYSAWDIPLKFWQQVWNPDAAGFQRHHTPNDDKSESADQLKSISIGFRWVAGWSGFINVFAHYNNATSRLLLFIRESQTLGEKPLLEVIQAHVRLSQRPLESLGLLLMTSCDIIIADIQKCGAGVSTIEVSLAVSVDVNRLQNLGYSRSGRSLSEENKVLHSLQKRISANSRGCGYVASICSYYMDFAADLQDQFKYAIPLEDVEEVIRRLSVTNSFLLYQDKMVQTQFTILHNMILREDTKISIKIAETSKSIAEAARKDSLAMKTIAYLTLAFLPTTFVSAIFSTTVLDFQNWSPKNSAPRVVSSGWWVFALTCTLATAMTLLIYFFWHWNQNSVHGRQVPGEEMAGDPNCDDGLWERQISRPLAQDIIFTENE